MMKKWIALLMTLMLCLAFGMPAGAQTYEIGNHPSHPAQGGECLMCEIAQLLLDLPDAATLTDDQVQGAADAIERIDAIKSELDNYTVELTRMVGEAAFVNYQAVAQKVGSGYVMITKSFAGITDEDLSRTQVAFNIEKLGDASFGTQVVTLSESGSPEAIAYIEGASAGELGTAVVELPAGSYRISEVAAPAMIDGAWVETDYATFNGERADSIVVEVKSGEETTIKVVNTRRLRLTLTASMPNSDTADITYEICVTKPENFGGTVDEYGSDYYVGFYFTKNNTVVTNQQDIQVEGATYVEEDRTYYAVSGETFSVTMNSSCKLHIIGLPENSRFSVQKTAPDDIIVQSVKLGTDLSDAMPFSEPVKGMMDSGDADVMYSLKKHVHDWEYRLSESKDTIIEACSDEECSLHDVGATIRLAVPDKRTYDGAPKTVSVVQDPVGRFDDLPDVAYEGNWTDAGEHTATLTYRDITAEVTFTIEPANIANAAVSCEDQTYTGMALEPEVVVTMNGNTLSKGVDYTVAYEDNIEAGWAMVTVTGMGNYAGQKTIDFLIARSEAAMTAAADQPAYTYGDTITITGTVRATGTPVKARTYVPSPTVELWDEAGNKRFEKNDDIEYEDGVGSFTLTYDTSLGDIQPSDEPITLMVKYVFDQNMEETSVPVSIRLSAKPVTPVLSGTAVKAYDGTTDIPAEHSLSIGLTGLLEGDQVSAGGSIVYAYADAAVGEGKTVNASGITTLNGTDAQFYALSAETASAAVGKITKAQLTGMAAPLDQTLSVYYADAAAAAAELPTTAAYTIEGGGTINLAISWRCDQYDNTPSKVNTFVWTLDDDEKLACYEPADGVATTGSIAVTNRSAIKVTLTGTDRSVTYDGSAFDVSAMFDIGENAGAASYEIVAGGTGEGEGALNGSALTIRKAGTFEIKLKTAANGAYAAAEATAVLTVHKGTPVVTLPAGLTAVYTQKLSDVSLPEDAAGVWSWENADALVGNAGEQVHKAVFTPNNLDLWNAALADVTVLVIQSGTDLTGEGLNHADGQYVYGEDIVVVLKANANGHAAVRMLRSTFTAPQERQMALYKRAAGQADEQMTSPVREENGVYVLTLRTEDKLLAIGENTIVAKYAGDSNTADAEHVYTVSIAKKPLTLSDVTAQDRYYKAGDKSVEITGAKLAGLESDADGMDDVQFAGGQMGMLESDAVGAYAAVTLEAPMLAGKDASWYALEGAEYAAEVSILSIPESGLTTRVNVNPNYTDADVLATDLGKKPQLDTVAEIDVQLRLSVMQMGAISDSAVLHDVVLEYLDVDGTWKRADKEHFPAGGIEVTLPVIQGTTPQTHSYTVAHMFTMNMNGHNAGEIEYPEVVAYQDASGAWMLKFTVTGLSPMMVAAIPIPSTALVPKTGDSSNMMLYAMLLTICVIALAAGRKRRTE